MTTSWHEHSWAAQHLDNPSPASCQSFRSSPFLTPPHLNQLDHPAPFKPPASDTTSLSLKKRHHLEHGKRSRGHVNSAKVDHKHEESNLMNTSMSKPSRTQSLPYLRKRRLSGPGGLLFTSSRTTGGRTATSEIRRRWTLESKSESTRGLSTLSPIFKHHPPSGTKRHRPSPAIITLRRASDKPARTASITFFPPPNFSRSKTSLISSFLSSIAGADTQQSGNTDGVSKAGNEQGVPGQDSLDKKSSNPKNEIASPTVTRVSFEHNVSLSAAESQPFRPRRCSTQYVTRSSVYEVIWDENDSPSSNSELSSRRSAAFDLGSRRESAAVAQLETRLSRADAQSRRTSCSSYREEVPTADLYSSRRWSFRAALNSSLSRLSNEAALRNLPYSRASKQAQSSISSISAGRPTHRIVDDSDDFASCMATEVFPPVNVSRVVHVGHQERDSASMETTEDRISSCGSQETECRRDRQGRGSKKSAHDMGSATRPRSLNDDRIPLLHEFRWDEAGIQ